MAVVYNLTFVFEDTLDHLILGKATYALKEPEPRYMRSVCFQGFVLTHCTQNTKQAAKSTNIYVCLLNLFCFLSSFI